MKRNYSILAVFIGMITWSCTSSHSFVTGVINLEEGLSQMETLPLSKVAASIEYIPLEDTDESLVGNIQNLFYNNSHIYIKDNTGLIKIFDRKGRFVRKINRLGRGPQEYSQMSILLPAPNGNFLLADFSEHKEYNVDGNLIRKIEYPKVDYRIYETLMIDENRYIAPLCKKYDGEYCAVIYDSLSTILQMIPIPDLYGPEKKQSNIGQRNLFSLNQGSGEVDEIQFVALVAPEIFRYGDQIRIFYPKTAEIFTTDGYGVLDTAFVINYGKYPPPGGEANDYTRSLKALYPNSFLESENYLFMNVAVRNILVNQAHLRGNFIFDKRTMNTHLLYDIEKRINGFTDDLKGGPPFWPKSVYGKDLLISYADPSYLIKLSEQNKVSDEFRHFVSGLTDDSNPVVIFVHLK